MKKTLIIGVATLGLALGAYGQGSVAIDNTFSAYGPVEDAALNYYGGTFGLEVWYQNGVQPIAPVNSFAGVLPDGNAQAYDIVDGWTLAATFAGQNNSGTPGVIQLGALNIPGVSPAGGQITLALAMWTGAHASWALASADPLAKGGVVALNTATVNYNLQPPPTPTTIEAGWDAAGTDLILTPFIPEPSSLALGAMGLAALLIRRRK
jgi:hypothetical protein